MHGNVIDSIVTLMRKNKRTDRTLHFGFKGLRYAVDAFMPCCLLSAFSIVQKERDIQKL
jgi:hypothetical protein